MQTHTMTTVKMLSAREAEKSAAERRAVRGSAECGSSSSSSSECSGKAKEMFGSAAAEERKRSRLGEVGSLRSRRNDCRDP